jgi:superfamily I DNA and/or RNA helicase
VRRLHVLLQVILLQQLVARQHAAAAAKAGSSPACPAPGAATHAAAGGASGVEVLTIDRCQGRDKPVILLSFVRASAGGLADTLLADLARLNVAVTRAKVCVCVCVCFCGVCVW